MVDTFLAARPEVKKQIVSLGAGSDTRFFRLMTRNEGPPNMIYHELDFPVNTEHKIQMIMKSSVLRQVVERDGPATLTKNELSTPMLHIHAIDLRTLDPDQKIDETQEQLKSIDSELPTLLISECCLTYLKPNAADAVVKYFSKAYLKPDSPVGLALYEPINPFDAFGKVMISNLSARGIVLQTVNKYSSLDAQKARMRLYSLNDGQGAVDAWFLQEHWIGEEEKERINHVEFLDEVEELKMLMEHYSVAWGWRNGSNGDVWERWRMIQSQPT